MRRLMGIAVTVAAIAGQASFITAGGAATGSTEEASPWDPMLLAQAPIRLRHPKAVLTGSIPEGTEPVLQVGLEDLGKYFGYLFPPVIVGFQMTHRALDRLYPDSLPERGQIRIASQGESDFLLAASYITGARRYYFIDGVRPSDLVIDPSLRDPRGYTMVFQRKDTLESVRVRFIRKAHLPDDEEYKFLAGASVAILNDGPLDDPGRAKALMVRTMKAALEGSDAAYEVEELKDYTFPEE